MFEDVYKSYRPGAPVLRGMNLIIERGEFVAVMGASGSGKSTLMNIFGCLDRPSGGRLLLTGLQFSATVMPPLARMRIRPPGFLF